MTDVSQDTAAGQSRIVDDIRHRVVTGDLAPGGRLPGHRKLVEQYDSSMVTVQKAMQRLIEQGFVESVPRRGRFVAEHPPHSHRVAVAFPGHPDEISDYRWTMYLAALWASARRLSEQTEWELVPYFDIEPDRQGNLTDGYRALMRDVRASRVAGIVFCYSPHNLSDTELMEDRPVPAVCLTGGRGEWGPTVTVEKNRVLERAVARLVQRHRHRLAWVMIMKYDPQWLRAALEELNERYGFYTPPRWIHPMNQFHPKWVRHSLRTMLEAPAGERPDGLVIWDDHLIEPVAKALKEMEVEVPEQLEVVGYWNFPLAYEGDLPITRLGQDTQEQFRVALELLRRERGGSEVPLRHRIDPITAPEFRERYGHNAEVAYEEITDAGELTHV
jgi:hypothetical protein